MPTWWKFQKCDALPLTQSVALYIPHDIKVNYIAMNEESGKKYTNIHTKERKSQKRKYNKQATRFYLHIRV